MKKIGLCLCAALVSTPLLAGAQAVDPADMCEGKEVGAECWMELQNRRDCYVWNGRLAAGETASFEGRGRCRGKQLSGTGTLKWRWREGEEGKAVSTAMTGRFVRGKAHGDFEEQLSDGGRATGPYVEGNPHGDWVITYPNGTEDKWDVQEGPFVNNKRHGPWIFQNFDDTGKLYQTGRGSFAQGALHGDWLWSSPPGTDGLWDSVEQSYVDGKLQGVTLRTDYDSEGRLIQEQSGSYADGEQHGPWVEVSYEEVRTLMGEGSLGTEERQRAEGTYVNGKRQGEWSVRKSHTLGGGQIAWRSHEYGPYVQGQRSGDWVEVNYTITHDERDRLAREGDPTQDFRRRDAVYARGKLHGLAVSIWYPGEFVLREDGEHADGDLFLRTEGFYSEGNATGTWKDVWSDGRSAVLVPEQGQEPGSYEQRDAEGQLVVAARYEGGEVVDLQLPKAAPPTPAANSQYAPVSGAFGIELGPNIDQLRGLRCQALAGSTIKGCLTQLGVGLHTAFRINLEGAGLQIASQVPQPITRGQAYFVDVSPRVGISELRAELRFESEEACEQEHERIDGLLREKYGECRDYRAGGAFWNKGRPIGQCDTDGLPVVRIRTICGFDSVDRNPASALILTYEMLTPSERDDVIAAWREKGEVRASEL